MKPQLKNFFTYNLRHRNGILLLCGLIIGVHFSKKHILQVDKPEKIDYSDFEDEIRQLKDKVKLVEEKKEALAYTYKKREKTKPLNFVIEMNSADTSDFKRIKGIGSFFAKRICKYRSLLGGFYDESQLLEVYGMDSARYNMMLKFVKIDLRKIDKLQVNSINFENLKSHPYISYNQARVIVNYRKKHGFYSSKKDFLNIDLISELDFKKIAPYLQFDDSTKITIYN